MPSTTSKKYYIFSGKQGEDFREWLVKFEATLGVNNIEAILKVDVPALRAAHDEVLADEEEKKKLTDRQKILLNYANEAWHTLQLSVAKRPLKIVCGHAKTRDVNAALKELKKEYLKDDEDHLQIHLDRFYERKFKNAWESPVEVFEDLLEINDEIEECDEAEAKSARSLFVHFKGLRPRVDTENPGSLELQIGMKYDSFFER
jgi:hypothetical protein